MKTNSLLLLIPAIMSLLALAPLPYGYYTLLRIVVCGAAIWTVICAYDLKRQWMVWLFGFITVLFNPLIPIHLDRQLWVILDVLTAVVFFVSIFILKRQ